MSMIIEMNNLELKKKEIEQGGGETESQDPIDDPYGGKN